ncbi:MAG TPA: protein translocase subunit SecD [Vicinamibacterales bacterium]|nr:protein translocase subunit SecD [Vicinamibacterales bacterium]
MKNLRWRIILIVVIVGACLWAIIPPAEKIRLGLDLKGGVHLVLQVNTEDALRLETETTAESLRAELEKAGVAGATVQASSPTEFQVSGLQPGQDTALRQATNALSIGWERESGVGGTYVYRMRGNRQSQLREESVAQAEQTILRRVDDLGVAEPVVTRHGGTRGNQLLVQLPGVSEVARAKEIIRSTAMLELALVQQGPASTQEGLLQATGGQVPPNGEVLPGVQTGPDGRTETVYYLLDRAPIVTGRDLRNARPTLDEFNQPAVHFSLKPEGAAKFGKATGDNVGRQLAIVLDNQVRSAPRIDERISDEGRITGGFTQQEAQDLSLVLRSGALPASLTYLEERTIGPSLGADSIRSGVVASLLSLAMVTVFMLFFYRLSGINALVALVFNLIILLGAMSYVGAAMTLPGIAGFILTIGMGVDSNVLIFERIKEELSAQRGVRASINAGFTRVFLTLVDTHLAALIGAAFLFQFGTGPIRGFATTLFFGLVSNLFTSTFVSRTLFEMVLNRRQVETLSI